MTNTATAVKDTAKTKTATTKTATKSRAKKQTPVITEQAIKEVALKINKEFCGINLFYVDRKYYTTKDKTFFSEMHMHWHTTGRYWFVKLRDKDQVVRIVNHFKDRLDIPEDLNGQLSSVLGDTETQQATAKKSRAKSKSVDAELAGCPF